MNQEKKYRKSRLRDLLESVSVNLPLSVCPYLQSASQSPPCLEIASLLYPRIPTHQWPRNQSFLMLPSWKRGPHYSAAYPRLLESTSLVRCSIGSLRCCEALCHSLESLAAAYLRLMLYFFVSSLLRGLFFYYSASFFYFYITVSYKTL